MLFLGLECCLWPDNFLKLPCWFPFAFLGDTPLFNQGLDLLKKKTQRCGLTGVQNFVPPAWGCQGHQRAVCT